MLLVQGFQLALGAIVGLHDHDEGPSLNPFMPRNTRLEHTPLVISTLYLLGVSFGNTRLSLSPSQEGTFVSSRHHLFQYSPQRGVPSLRYHRDRESKVEQSRITAYVAIHGTHSHWQKSCGHESSSSSRSQPPPVHGALVQSPLLRYFFEL